MFKSLLAFAFVFAGLTAKASDITIIAEAARNAVLTKTFGLDFKEGEKADYSVDMSFVQGTMEVLVHKIETDGVWIHQNMDLGMMGKQKIEIFMDPNTGEVKKLIVNGKDQALPKNDISVVDQKSEQVTVPKGTFDCIYVKVQDNKSKDITEQWVDMSTVPVFGLVKTIAPSQIGQVTIELTDFVKK